MSRALEASSGLPDDIDQHFATHLLHLALLSLSWWDDDIGLVVDKIGGGEDSDDVIGFNSDKSWNLRDDNDTSVSHPWLDLDTTAMANASNMRDTLERECQSQQDALILSQGPFREQLRPRFASTWRQLEELRARLSQDGETQHDELVLQLEQVGEELRLGAESIMPNNTRDRLITGEAIEPYYTDQLASSDRWRGVRYSKLAILLQDAQAKAKLKASQSQEASAGFTREDSDASPAPVYSLADAILNHTVTSYFHDRPAAFLPEGQVHELISPEAIAAELPTLSSESLEDLDLFDFLLVGAKKILGICVLLRIDDRNLYEMMRLFHHSGFNDGMLPVHATIHGSLEMFPVHFNNSLWSMSTRRGFFEMQWIFLAPVFLSAEVKRLSSDCVLPITWKSSTTREGWFGKVSEAEIHPDHLASVFPVIGSRLDQVLDDPPIIAIKHLSESGVRRSILHDPDPEYDVRFSHKHLVRTFGTFVHDSESYMLLEWANKGNIRSLWVESPTIPELSPRIIKETLVQLRGLADALCHVYEGRYYLGELTPRSILRFQEGDTCIGRLKIADTFHRERLLSLDATSEILAGRYEEKLRYKSPEIASPISRPETRGSDIWSMGCIIIEHLIWLLYGKDELSRFNRNINDFYWTKLGVERVVHPWVTAWLDHMSNDDECAQATAMRDLLDMVCTKLLIVSSESRATSQIFRDCMDDILDKAVDERYLYTGKKRENVRGFQDRMPGWTNTGYEETIQINFEASPTLKLVKAQTKEVGHCSSLSYASSRAIADT
jgi:serine/threonine protein kinase